MTEYANWKKLAAQLTKVRAAWRRTAALAGAALVLLECIGIFTVAVLLSFFYGHIPAVRVGLFAVSVAAACVLAVRHVVLPLLRPIPDEAIALYVEEHSDAFEGSLITAAEYGPRGGVTPRQAQMIEAVLRTADVRAARAHLGSVVSVRRLGKYAAAALALLAAYAVMCTLFPQTLGKQVVRVTQPWRPDAAPPPPPGAEQVLSPEEIQRRLPIDFALSVGDVRMPRGADLALEAQLSRRPHAPVNLFFRSVADPNAPGQWQQLAMREIEKLHGFAWTLQSVSEPLEFYVAAENYRSPSHRVAVYDRIELQGAEVATRYPGYLELPERFVALSNGDVSAPIGSKVTVRVLTNAELAGGKLIWEGPPSGGDGVQEQALTLDPQRNRTAAASFDVRRSGRYRFEVTDVDGQVARSPGPCEVVALKDHPPTIELLSPMDDVETHPLGEVTFQAKATDDFGVAGLDLVYVRFSRSGSTGGRLPLDLRRQDNPAIPLPEMVDAELRLLLESMTPALQPGEVLSWCIEARDRKPDNPPAASDLHMIVILPFEMWSAYELTPAEAPEPDGDFIPIQEILRLTWDLHRQKPKLAAEAFHNQCEGIAGQMVVGEAKTLKRFMKLPSHPSPRMREVYRQVQECGGLAYKALLKFDTAEALVHLRRGVAILIAAGVTDSEILQKLEGMPPGMEAAGTPPPQQARLAELFAALKLDIERKLGAKLEASLQKSQAAEDAAKAIREVRAQQQEVLKRAEGAANSPAEGQAQPDAGGQLQQLGQREQALAEKAKGVAGDLKASAQPPGGEAPADAAGGLQGAADKVAKAAAGMQAAAAELGKAQVAEARRQAQEADKLLAEAETQLGEAGKDELSAGLGEAERIAEGLLRDQVDIRQGTEKASGPASKPSTAQPTPAQRRDMKKLAARQVGLKAAFEGFSGKMDKLAKWAQDSRPTEAAKGVQEAQRTMKRSQPGQKMANAVVELGGESAASAVREQKAAEQGLAKVLGELRAAGDALAATREETLKRALREAGQVRKGVEKIASADGTGEAGKPAGEAPKPAGESPKPGDESDQAGDEAGQKLAPGERRDLGRQIATDVRRLDRQLETRDFGLGQDGRELQRVARDPALEDKLIADPVAQVNLRKLIGRVEDKLEAELESTAKAKRMLAAQREQCPPQYRYLVSKYYEALSKRTK